MWNLPPVTLREGSRNAVELLKLHIFSLIAFTYYGTKCVNRKHRECRRVTSFCTCSYKLRVSLTQLTNREGAYLVSPNNNHKCYTARRNVHWTSLSPLDQLNVRHLRYFLILLIVNISSFAAYIDYSNVHTTQAAYLNMATGIRLVIRPNICQ